MVIMSSDNRIKISASGPNDRLHLYSATIVQEFKEIDDSRRDDIKKIAEYIIGQITEKRRASLLFVCTHNSRRSQLAQVWIKIATVFYGVNDIASFSGGTEVSGVNIRVIRSLERAGVTINCPDPGLTNPVYNVMGDELNGAMKLFSKLYDDPANPDTGFCAVMVCSDADEACPVVAGADMRTAIPYSDPGYSDDSPSETEIYDATCRTIAREMFFTVSLIKKSKTNNS